MSNFTKPSCRDFPQQMWLCLSDELPAVEKEFWQLHLQSCARCQEVFNKAQSVQEQYASLPLYDAPAPVIRKIIRPAQAPRRSAWWETFVRRYHIFFDFRPRPMFAGVVFAILVLGFHYLAFQQPTQSAWEAEIFDTRAEALANTLLQYDVFGSGEPRQEGFEPVLQFSWDEQATGLRTSIAALEYELQNSKL